MQESVAMGESLNYHISTNFKLSDMFTKKFVEKKNRSMVEGVLYDVFD